MNPVKFSKTRTNNHQAQHTNNGPSVCNSRFLELSFDSSDSETQDPLRLGVTQANEMRISKFINSTTPGTARSVSTVQGVQDVQDVQEVQEVHGVQGRHESYESGVYKDGPLPQIPGVPRNKQQVQHQHYRGQGPQPAATGLSSTQLESSSTIYQPFSATNNMVISDMGAASDSIKYPFHSNPPPKVPFDPRVVRNDDKSVKYTNANTNNKNNNNTNDNNIKDDKKYNDSAFTSMGQPTPSSRPKTKINTVHRSSKPSSPLKIQPRQKWKATLNFDVNERPTVPSTAATTPTTAANTATSDDNLDSTELTRNKNVAEIANNRTGKLTLFSFIFFIFFKFTLLSIGDVKN